MFFCCFFFPYFIIIVLRAPINFTKSIVKGYFRFPFLLSSFCMYHRQESIWPLNYGSCTSFYQACPQLKMTSLHRYTVCRRIAESELNVSVDFAKTDFASDDISKATNIFSTTYLSLAVKDFKIWG